MSDYSFRIRFFLSPGTQIGLSGSRHKFDVPSLDDPLDLRPYDKEEPIEESVHLVLEGAEYDSEDEASRIGQRAHEALLWCGLRGNYGVDLGDGQPSGRFSNYIKERVKEQTGVRLLDDAHGLLVYKCHDPTRFGRMSAEATVTKSPDQFRTDFTDFVDTGVNLDPSVSLALELSNLAYFEASNRAQFLTRMLAVETVLPDLPASEAAQELVDDFIAALQEADLDEDERKSLVGWAGHMKKQSISRTGQHLAAEHLGSNEYGDESAPDFFKTAYDGRSKLVHNGELPDDGPKVRTLNNALRNFVSDLLEAIVTNRNPALAG